MNGRPAIVGIASGLILALAGCGGGGGGGEKVAPQLMEAAVTSGTTVLLTFSEAMDASAGDPVHYDITPDLVVTGAQMSAFGTQVLLTTLPLTAGVTYTVIASEVTDEKGNLIDPNANAAIFLMPPDDGEVPKLLGAVVTSPTTILVTFSEPMQDTTGDAARYTLEAGGVITDAELSEFKTQVLLHTLPLTAGVQYTLSAATVRDAGGNLIDPAANSATLSYGSPAPDTESPQVLAVMPTGPRTIIVMFNEPLQENASSLANFTLDPPTSITQAQFNETRTQILLTTADPLTPRVSYRVNVTNVTDPSSNPIGPITITPTFVLDPSVPDTSPPRVLGAVATSATTMLVTFSEPMNASAGDAGRYQLTPAATVTNVQLSELRTQAILTVLPLVPGVPYSVSVNNVVDVAGNTVMVTSNTASTAFGTAVIDLEAPRVIRAVATSPTSILVSFSEPMDDRAADPVRYTLAPGGTVIGAQANQFNTQILLNVLPLTPGVSYSVTVAAITDKAGNTIVSTASAATVSIGAAPNDTTPPRMTAAVPTSATTILVSFSEPMDETAGDPVRYSLMPSGVITAAELSRFKTQVLLTTLPLAPGAQLTLSAPTLVDAAGNVLLSTASSVTLVFGSVVDTQSPQLLGAAIFGPTTIVLTFSEPLAADAANPALYSLTPAVTVLNAQLNEQRTQVVLTTTSLQSDTQYSVMVNGGAKDAAGNSVTMPAPVTVTPGGQINSSGELPRVVGAASTSNTTVVVKFSKSMSDSALDPSHYFIELQPDTGVLTLANRCVSGPHRGDLCSSGGVALRVCGGGEPRRGQICRADSDCDTGIVCETGCTGSDCQGARFLDAERTLVELQTLSQNDGIYSITATGTTDAAGNPMAPKHVVAGGLVDPTTATFPGTAPVADGMLPGNAGVDSDGDDMPDTDEQAGWDVGVKLLNGDTATQHVTANPLFPDTDGDGILDPIEFSIGSNPRSNDTDGDGLTDDEEFNVVYSDPTNQDSDGDSISDFLEVEFFKTNAVTEDSDGDGYTDSEELFEMNRDPRIADLPLHAIAVGTVQLQIDERFTFTDENGETDTEVSSTSAEMSSSVASSESRLSQDVGQFLIGLNGGIDSCQTDAACDPKAAVFVNGPRAFANATIEAGGEFTRATTTDENEALEEAFTQSLEKVRELSQTSSVTREVVGARMDVEVELRNEGDVAFTLSNIEITVQMSDPDDPTRFVPIATLIPNRTLLTGESVEYNVGPFQSRSPILFSNSEIFPNLVEDLMRAPRALMFKVSNFDLTTADGRNFVFGFQTIRERTTGIIIDFGDGSAEQMHVTTAGVLNRARDDLRCAPGGSHPDRPCSSDTDCGTSVPCEGGRIIGGFAGFGGTGQQVGIPLDFVLRDLLGLRKTAPPIIVAGNDGEADTIAIGDDVQVENQGTTGLTADAVVVLPGRNGILDTHPADDDLNPTPPDGILAGADGVVRSVARGDDIQVIPLGTAGVPEDAVAIEAGENGALDTTIRGDDVADVVTGYETSVTCNGDTTSAIVAGTNGVAETTASGDDVQEEPVDTMLLSSDTTVVSAGSDDLIRTVPAGDDIFVGPGIACSHDSDCGSGLCDGPETVVRVANRRSGEFHRQWTLLMPDQSQFQTDFGQIQMRAGQVLALAFVQDLDRDGLISQEEFIQGSSDLKRDTDDDKLDDFVEVRIGWDVGVFGQPLRRVFPDPGLADSDRDGLTDREEQDLRELPRCKVSPAPTVCIGDVSRHRIDPRRRDTDADGVWDFDEVFGYLTGRGVLDPAHVVVAGQDRTANTTACPMNRCACPLGQPACTQLRCVDDGDCLTRQCVVQAGGCDDVQLEVPGTGGLHPSTAVVGPGQNGTLDTAAETGDSTLMTGDGIASTDPVADDVPVVGRSEKVFESGLCADGSDFGMCAVIRPGPNGSVDSLPTGTLQSVPPVDDVIARFGQRRELTNPLHPDTDQDEISDGIEEILGSSPSNPGDTGSPADTDQDGLTDNQEARTGWPVSIHNAMGTMSMRRVSSNPNLADTDLDGLPDYAERHMPCVCAGGTCSNDNSPCSTDRQCTGTCPTDPTKSDTDSDALSDYDELSAAQFEDLKRFNDFFRGFDLDDSDSLRLGTDPTRVDTDRDGLTDDFELFAGWTVILSDGSIRQVFSDPRQKDTDDDGADDKAERDALCAADNTRTCPIDPSDPDTDGDERLDGAELDANTDPLVEDLAVRVRFRRIEIDAITDGSTANTTAEFGWWFTLLKPGKAPLLMSSALRFGCISTGTPVQAAFPGAGRCANKVGKTCDDDFMTPASGRPACDQRGANDFPCCTASEGRCEHRCYNLPIPTANRYTLQLDEPITSSSCANVDEPPLVADHTFTLRRGQSFTVEGLLVELDGALGDCGHPPHYIPSSFASGCFTRFNKTFNFSELQRGQRGEPVAVNPVDGNAVQGGDTCSWQVQLYVEVN